MSLVSFSGWDDDDDDGLELVVVDTSDDIDLLDVVVDTAVTIVSALEELANTLLYYAYEIYYWLTDVAPTLIKAQLRQLGRDGIDSLPFLSEDTKKEIKRWLRDNFGL